MLFRSNIEHIPHSIKNLICKDLTPRDYTNLHEGLELLSINLYPRCTVNCPSSLKTLNIELQNIISLKKNYTINLNENLERLAIIGNCVHIPILNKNLKTFSYQSYYKDYNDDDKKKKLTKKFKKLLQCILEKLKPCYEMIEEIILDFPSKTFTDYNEYFEIFSQFIRNCPKLTLLIIPLNIEFYMNNNQTVLLDKIKANIPLEQYNELKINYNIQVPNVYNDNVYTVRNGLCECIDYTYSY